jgi:hypothetical protein
MRPKTDDRGRFYEPALPSGTYTVEATLPEANLLPSGILGVQSINVELTTGGALHTFYGDKFRLKDAAVAEIKEGEDRAGVDITIPTGGLHALSGTITAQADGRSITHGKVRLLDSDDKTVVRETSIEETGFFTFNYVMNGSYLVQIQPQSGAQGEKLSPGLEPMTVPLQVLSDLPNLSYSLSAAKH